MNTKRAVFTAVLVVGIAAIAVPMVGMRAAAAGGGVGAGKAVAATASGVSRGEQQVERQIDTTRRMGGEDIRGDAEGARGDAGSESRRGKRADGTEAAKQEERERGSIDRVGAAIGVELAERVVCGADHDDRGPGQSVFGSDIDSGLGRAGGLRGGPRAEDRRFFVFGA